MNVPTEQVLSARSDCINLKQRFGKRYRVEYEESYYAAYGANANREDPWFMVIPCKNGHIFPWGGDTLATSVDGHPKIARQLERLGCQTEQDGNDGHTLTFHVDDFLAVATVMKPRAKRRLSPEHREKLIEAGRPFTRNDRQAESEGGFLAPESLPTPIPVCLDLSRPEAVFGIETQHWCPSIREESK